MIDFKPFRLEDRALYNDDLMNHIGITNADGSALLAFETIRSAPSFGLPPFQIAKFDLTAIIVMAPIAIVSMMEHVGDISAISVTTERNFLEDPGLNKTPVCWS